MYCTFLGILEHAWGEGEIPPPSFASSVLKLPIFPPTPTQPNPSPTVHVFWVCSAVAPLFFTAIFCHDGRSLLSLFLLLLFWENRLWLQKRRRRRHEITLRRGNQHWHQKATYYCLKQSFFLEKSSYSIWSFMRWKGETVGNRFPISRFVESVFDWVMHSILNALPLLPVWQWGLLLLLLSQPFKWNPSPKNCSSEEEEEEALSPSYFLPSITLFFAYFSGP